LETHASDIVADDRGPSAFDHFVRDYGGLHRGSFIRHVTTPLNISAAVRCFHSGRLSVGERQRRAALGAIGQAI
jgi:hypothetical protein